MGTNETWERADGHQATLVSHGFGGFMVDYHDGHKMYHQDYRKARRILSDDGYRRVDTTEEAQHG